MRVPKTIILAFLLLIAVAFGAAFFPVPSDTNNSQPLRIGFSQWVGYDIAIYAQESGLFEQHGLNIELIRFDESNDAARAVLRGQLDAGFTNFGRAMLFDDGTPVHVVLATDISHGGDGIVARAGIQSVPELVGKRIGCKRRAVNQIILAEALQAHGYTLADVEQVDVTNTVAERMLMAGEIDAMVTWDPHLERLARETGAAIVFRTNEIQSVIVDSLIVRTDRLKHIEPDMRELRSAWFVLLEKVEADPDKVFAVVADRLGLTPEQVTASWSGILPGTPELNKRVLSEDFESILRRTADFLEMPVPSAIRALPMDPGEGDPS